uniref:Ran-binding protein 1 c n=1 Tax=Anthurium amnicola TaxID=1678845 RepID=A0A1D1Y964_9ARAE
MYSRCDRGVHPSLALVLSLHDGVIEKKKKEGEGLPPVFSFPLAHSSRSQIEAPSVPTGRPNFTGYTRTGTSGRSVGHPPRLSRSVPTISEETLFVHTTDFADGELKKEMFCIRFESVESKGASKGDED